MKYKKHNKLLWMWIMRMVWRRHHDYYEDFQEITMYRRNLIMSNGRNIMGVIAEEYDLNLGEQFLLKNFDKTVKAILIEDGLHTISDEGILSSTNHKLLSKLCMGLYQVEKIPFVPKVGDPYFRIHINDDGETYQVIEAVWEGKDIDYMARLAGLVYQTLDEALSNLPDDYKRLKTGDYFGEDEDC